MDENGYVFIEDRKKDMILVSGFNVYPNEVEGVAVTHPACSRSPPWRSRRAGRRRSWRCSPVKKDPSLTEDQLIEHCRKALTATSAERDVYFRDELPKTNVGKILRRDSRTAQVGVRFARLQMGAVRLADGLGAPGHLQSCKPDTYLRRLSAPLATVVGGDVVARAAARRMPSRIIFSARSVPTQFTIVTHLPSPVLVVLEEVRDLVDERHGQVLVRLHALVERVSLSRARR